MNRKRQFVMACPCTRINILGADPRMNPFNNDYFNGRCNRVRNPYSGTYDRIPWNVGDLRYEVSQKLYFPSYGCT